MVPPNNRAVLLAKIEADTCAAFSGFVGARGLEKTVEYVGQAVGMDTGAGIGDREVQTVVFKGIFCRYLPADRREFERVGAQVEQDLTTFLGVYVGHYFVGHREGE